MGYIKESELILNPDQSIYHLNLRPENVASTVIFVGDQNRVAQITKYFDTIEFSTQKREFKTQTGTFNGKRISVISTGIGPDNIDIVMNELDALVNIDFTTRTIKPRLTSLNIIRIGTSGSLQANIPIDSMLLSVAALGTDNTLSNYNLGKYQNHAMKEAFVQHTNWKLENGSPYAIDADADLVKKFKSDQLFEGITITACGFFGAQGRVLRLQLKDKFLNDKINSFEYNSGKATNLEMETAAIYGLSKMLGHKAISLNAIIANRMNGTFSTNSYNTIDRLIEFVLNKITE